jgi:hypothetical protein
MDEHGNLKHRVGIQKSQVEGIEIDETVEKGRNQQTQSSGQEGNENNCLMSVLYQDSDPLPHPPRALLLGGRTPIWTR